MSKHCSCSCEDEPVVKKAEHADHDGHDHDHEGHDHSHDTAGKTPLQLFMPAIVSFVLLALGLLLDHVVQPAWFTGVPRWLLYMGAYLPVGWPVLKEAFESGQHGNWFSEFFLMGIATVGAFAIGQYPEGVAVMLFYTVGEVFQGLAVQRAKGNIKALLDQRPDEVTLLQNQQPKVIKAESAQIGHIMQLKAGEQLALDGVLLSDVGTFNTAALTGESKPDTKRQGEVVLAGMINLQNVVQVQITTAYQDSKLSKILALVQDATRQKAPTELFISKFAKVYTPIVVALAVAITLLPYLFVQEYVFSTWLYRALVFLVISCPCALVISIPLGYFGGIGAGSRHGILFKGSNFLDSIANIDAVVMDKTGTLTEGVFKVQQIAIAPQFNQAQMLGYLNVLESQSTHPIATAVHSYVGVVDSRIVLDNVQEIAGYGLSARIEGQPFVAGNTKLLDKLGISYPKEAAQTADTVIVMAYAGQYAGMVTIADQIKADAADAVAQLKQLGVTPTMLSGDKTAVVQAVAQQLGITQYFGDLLPEDKVNHLKNIKAQPAKNGKPQTVAFVGDGVNDAPVVALSDVGIAMGGLGSDATIETADVVIQDDAPSKIPMAIAIGQQTKKIVWQNITLAFVIKALVLLLGAGGIATMWEAVFADVGVALLAIMNAVRILNMDFSSKVAAR